MQTIKMSKEYTIDEIRDELAEKVELIKEELDRISNDLNTIQYGMQLKVLNLPNIRDNIGVSRRELYMVDQALESLYSNITSILVDNTEPPQVNPAYHESGESADDE
tara:strand:+ start:91 stop:411 length:321 start_codon:yes stop_codon:yes gene_type:complete